MITDVQHFNKCSKRHNIVFDTMSLFESDTQIIICVDNSNFADYAFDCKLFSFFNY